MKFQKSPFPYVLALVAVIAVAVYTTSTINNVIENPIEESISYNKTLHKDKRIAYSEKK